MSQHARRSVRLKGYDYTQAEAYFITLVCARWVARFGGVVGEEMCLNLAGECAGAVLQGCAAKFGAELGAWVVMPNHLHAVVVLPGGGGGESIQRRGRDDKMGLMRPAGTLPGSLGAFVQNYKSVSTRRMHALSGEDGPVWQRNYYEHIICDEAEWENFDAYIRANPARWREDEEYR